MERGAAPVGLCQTCSYSREVASPRGPVFWLCRKSVTDSEFLKYPVLPVEQCLGYERRMESHIDSGSGDGRRIDGDDKIPARLFCGSKNSQHNR